MQRSFLPVLGLVVMLGGTAATAQNFVVTPDPAAPPIRITQQAQLLFAQGQNYERGLNVPQDYAKAMDLYRQAVAMGHPLAEFRIGYLYERGWGVAKDNDQARAWYEKAAAQGIGSAKVRLATLPAAAPTPK